MKIISKIVLILSSLFFAFLISIEDYTYWHSGNEMVANGGREMLSLMNMIGSPIPLLYGYSLYFVIKGIFNILIAFFKKENTNTILKSLGIKSLIVSILFMVTYIISEKLDIGNPNLPIAGIAILFGIMLSILLIDYIYKKRKNIWNFLVNH